MNEWRVTLPAGGQGSEAKPGQVAVDAHTAMVLEGVLLFRESDGRLVRAFAPGAWLECELIGRAARGW